ncbi:sulfotransferase, partial [Alphaproteobacteria bacterium]|nr:sulfotransferase [Alphaproteobacteria bacterium]
MNLKSDIYSRKEIDNFVDDTLKKKYLSEAKAHLALAPLYFGLGRYSEKSDKKLSEECYLQANRHSSLVQRFNPLQHQKHIKNIKKIYLESLGKKLDTDDLGEGIIFIVGMPRSGTTLIESMLASNEQVISGGEMISMAELFKTHYEDEVSIPDFKKIGVTYNNRIKPIKRDYAFFIDKLPANYYHIGLILLSMPKAKFIHIHREPWDIAISLFKQLYIANIPFSSKFFSVACTIANYQHMTGFWNEELDDNRVMNLQYEDVVKNPKDSAKILYNFIGIKGEVNMKERSKFFSRTASKTQIQSNIHTKSLGKDDFADFKSQFYDDLENQKNYWK